jgi:hypothetical protein
MPEKTFDSPDWVFEIKTTADPNQAVNLKARTGMPETRIVARIDS